MNLFLSTSGKINADTLSHLRYGDIVVVYYENKLILGIIDNFIKENKLRIFEEINDFSKPNRTDKLIFSYDAIINRTGDKDAMIYLQQAFTNKTIQSFIDNLLDILFYREDRIDSEIYANFFSKIKYYHELTVYHLEKKTPVLIEKSIIEDVVKEKISNKDNNFKESPESYIFYDYLDPKCQNIWHQYYHYDEYKMRDIFNIIRKTYPQLFSSALKAFNTRNEHGNIYCLKTRL